ncbi:hypothetical protein J6590_004522 [Homalodisca vitripennis]|nr:hypothetical protein J6590_004522 [Homalodisca vitripennis]
MEPGDLCGKEVFGDEEYFLKVHWFFLRNFLFVDEHFGDDLPAHVQSFHNNLTNLSTMFWVVILSQTHNIVRYELDDLTTMFWVVILSQTHNIVRYELDGKVTYRPTAVTDICHET